MKSLILLICLFIPLNSYSQSISISSPSIQLWGVSQGMYHISMEYKEINIHYFHNTMPKIANNNLQSSFGVSYKPIKTKFINVGLLATNKPFPSEQAVHINFILDVGYSFNKFRLSYIHISNGFGIRNPNNDGYDSITLSIKF